MNIKTRIEALERKSHFFEFPMSNELIERLERAKARSKQLMRERSRFNIEKFARTGELSRQRIETLRRALSV